MNPPRPMSETEAALRAQIARDPKNPQGYVRLGHALIMRGLRDEAVAAWREALRLRPEFPPALGNLGIALAQAKRFDEAVPMLRRVAALTPDSAPAHNNLGNALAEVGDEDGAIFHLRRALQIDPKYFDAAINLTKALQKRGNLDEALATIGRAIALAGPHPEARFLRGLNLLLRGDLAQGFADYEFRRHCADFTLAPRKLSRPDWDGAPLDGRTILLHAEQGFGDTIQFVRYAPLVAARRGRVIVEVQPELTSLIRTIAGADAVISRGDPLPAFHVQASLLSLPHLCGTRSLDAIPSAVPYLSVDPARVAHWDAILSAESTTPRVGLVWAGNPSHGNDRNRSIPPADLVALRSVTDVSFYSLQKSARDTSQPPGVALIDHTASLHDFADTAALVQCLDLVITVDTSVAHLAGALAKPVWVLLPHVPDWRWLLHRIDSPWYPTARLFRQPRRGGWADVLADVAAALRAPR